MAYQADINAARALIRHAGLSGALDALAIVCEETAKEMRGQQPRSTSSEVAQAYRSSARTIERCARSIRHTHNRAGF